MAKQASVQLQSLAAPDWPHGQQATALSLSEPPLCSEVLLLLWASFLATGAPRQHRPQGPPVAPDPVAQKPSPVCQW